MNDNDHFQTACIDDNTWRIKNTREALVASALEKRIVEIDIPEKT